MTYYISQIGNDAASGLSPETAWRTTYRLFERIKGGDAVLLKRGDTFYGRIALPDGIDPEHRTVISAYGEGDKPRINLYKQVTQPSAWTEISPFVWRMDLTDIDVCGGDVYTDDANVGFLYIDGRIYGDRCFKLSELRNYWQFYCEGRYVYVCCGHNPNTLTDCVCFAVGGDGLRLGNHSEVRGLDIFGGGCHGIVGGVCDAVISDCDIHEFGGSLLDPASSSEVRFGNGIEFWCGGRDISVENNRISNIYDVGVTMQGFPTPDRGWDNVVYRGNIFWSNEQNLEIWTNDQKGGEGIRNCFFRGNICLDAGRGWSHNVRPNKDAGVHLLLYATLCKRHGIVIEHNVFCDPFTALYYKSFGEPDGEIPPDYVTRNNVIFLRKDALLIDRKYRYSEAQWDNFVVDLKKEIGSTVYLLPDDGMSIEKKIELYSEYLR